MAANFRCGFGVCDMRFEVGVLADDFEIGFCCFFLRVGLGLGLGLGFRSLGGRGPSARSFRRGASTWRCRAEAWLAMRVRGCVWDVNLICQFAIYE